VAQAQFTANFQTNIISGVTSNWAGNYIVGDTTFQDVLQLVNGGVISNDIGYLGFGIAGSNNTAIVAGAGSVWSNITAFVVGGSGAANSLVISNSGRVIDKGSGTIGLSPSSSNNLALVSGTGSVWSNANGLTVGGNGGGNQLIITNGGVVYGGGALGNSTQANHNSVVVSGIGSAWRGAVTVGATGSGNQLTISGGGAVFGGFNGVIGNTSFSSNNVVVVSDPGSVWSNGSLQVGYQGVGDQLIITNGGKVYNDFDAEIGYYPLAASNNVATVTGSGSVWSNNFTLAISGGGGPGDELRINNGGKVYVRTDASIGGKGNAATVAGSGSVWSNGTLSVGNVLGTMTVTNGGQVIDGAGYVGHNSNGSNNQVLVVGPGSIWNNNPNLYVGFFGAANALLITNNGQVADGFAYMSFDSTSSNNSVRVADGGVWQNGVLAVGYQGSSNSLVITGGSVLATNLVIGVATANCNNLVELDSGNLLVTNAVANAVLEVRSGQLILKSGLLQANVLVVTNACARLIRNGGQIIYNQLILDPNLSAVGDGISNGWKQQHALDPFDPNLGSEDADGDGMSNLQEFLAGTDPTNNASAFRITSVVSTGGNVLVTWMTGIGKTNALQVTSGTGNGSYATNNFADIFVITNTVGSTTNFLDVGAATNSPARYYRVRLVP
jgi:T5SS/PEP-CTERM-associated repeat protein